MNISIVCSDLDHPVRPWLESWQTSSSNSHRIDLVEHVSTLRGGDLLFLISCHEIVKSAVRDMYRATLVIHASDLPRGRGWSPHIWQILEGRNDITITLLEAADGVDCGAIWAQRVVHFEGHELHDEINQVLFSAEIALMDEAISRFDQIQPRPQDETAISYYPRRTPEDSRINPFCSIVDQFDLLRVADPKRFPAFFDLRGCRYEIQIKKMKDTPHD